MAIAQIANKIVFVTFSALLSVTTKGKWWFLQQDPGTVDSLKKVIKAAINGKFV